MAPKQPQIRSPLETTVARLQEEAAENDLETDWEVCDDCGNTTFKLLLLLDQDGIPQDVRKICTMCGNGDNGYWLTADLNDGCVERPHKVAV
jgi:hypothetical protein